MYNHAELNSPLTLYHWRSPSYQNCDWSSRCLSRSAQEKHIYMSRCRRARHMNEVFMQQVLWINYLTTSRRGQLYKQDIIAQQKKIVFQCEVHCNLTWTSRSKCLPFQKAQFLQKALHESKKTLSLFHQTGCVGNHKKSSGTQRQESTSEPSVCVTSC